MSFTSEIIINAPQPVVWDAIESGWHDVADGAGFEPEQSINTRLELDECNLIPELLRRKIGQELWVAVAITNMTHGQSINTHVTSSLNYVPSAKLFLSLSENRDQTRMTLRGDIESSLRQKAIAAMLRPTLLSSLGNYGLSILGNQIVYRPEDLAAKYPEAS
jgi:hypothetical protein